MQNVLDTENTVFESVYEKFNHEIHSDKEKDASVPSFTEIRGKIQSMGDLAEIEEYLKHVMR